MPASAVLTAAKVSHNRRVARGWESKDVESQLDDAAQKAADRARSPATAEERQRAARRRTVEMSLARVRNELKVTTAAARRAALESALEQLEAELARLGG